VNAYIKAVIAAAIVTLASASHVLAAETAKKVEKPHGAEEAKKDIADHRAMAEAHLNAAKCFESGKSEKECHGQLAKDCKGLAIGKVCGMKHRH
jgi:mannitol-specific phosphotransferase system IIBC component